MFSIDRAKGTLNVFNMVKNKQNGHREEGKITRLDKARDKAELDRILHPLVKKWFYSKFKKYSLPQLFGVFEVHARSNILISAPTGATKTLTAFLSILNELVDSAEKGILKDKVYAVYISPLKALNNDIEKNLVEPLQEMEELAGKKLGIRIGVRTGDTTPAERQRMLKKPPHILITTPESTAIMLSSPKFAEHFSSVDWCIVDEIHALAENKRGVHLSLSLERLQRLSPAMCRVGLSATVAPLDEIAHYLVGYGRDCLVCDVDFRKNLDLQVLCPVSNLIDTSHTIMHNALYNLVHKLIKEHKTTLIFTNTRSATERVVDYLKTKFPKFYGGNIAAHHGSLGKQLRQQTEDQLRKGELRAVVCSTSLELGIDIGYVDLVICLGSPKSVARFLQRAGRSGHRLHETVKGRIIVLDRDDLVECASLLRSALDRKIDTVHIPTNALDVLAQHIAGIVHEKDWKERELFTLLKQSWCYRDLSWTDYSTVLSYLAGEFVELEDRRVYGKIWRDKENNTISRRGMMSRVIYMTNIGTIPDESHVKVKIGDQIIGHLDEGFIEKLKRGDTFVLGGDVYEFKFTRGMTAQVNASVNRPPNVPSWFSEMLPLSFDLALDVGKFRRLVFDKFLAGRSRKEIIAFIEEYLPVDENAASSLYEYMHEQYGYCGKIPHDKLILIEHTKDDRDRHRVVFHTMFGRRTNDALSRALALVLGRLEQRDVEVSMNDNCFAFALPRHTNRAREALKLLTPEKLRDVLEMAIERSEVFKRRFRHCAVRSLMILRNYMGREKRAGRQQMAARLLISALMRIDKNFCILKEARRECLEDLMDYAHAHQVLEWIKEGKVRVEEITTEVPSPFAFNVAFQGIMDVLRIEDRTEFLKRMHQYVLAKIGMKEKEEQKAVIYE